MKYKVDETEHDSLIMAYLDLYLKTAYFVIRKVGYIGLIVFGVIVTAECFKIPMTLAIILTFGVPLVMTTYNFVKTIKEADHD